MNEISRLSRLTAILTMLQSKPLLTASAITAKFNISKRTAYRDIKALSDSGIPIHTIEGKGYSLVEGFNLPPVMFTEEEASALITAHNIILQNKDRSLKENHSSAIDKVKAVLRTKSKAKVDLLGERVAYMKNYKRDTTSDSLSTIQKAITDHQKIQIKYIRKDGVETERVIQSQALYHTQENWILIAWCEMRDAYREFRLDRIVDLKLLSEQFEARSFNFLNYFTELSAQSKNNP
jgi:predicted DNA-binding transcriptional regulator YafY